MKNGENASRDHHRSQKPTPKTVEVMGCNGSRLSEEAVKVGGEDDAGAWLTIRRHAARGKRRGNHRRPRRRIQRGTACNYFSEQRTRTGASWGPHTVQTPALATHHRNANRVLAVGGAVARGREGVREVRSRNRGERPYQLRPPALLPAQSPPSLSMSMLPQLVCRPIDCRDSRQSVL